MDNQINNATDTNNKNKIMLFAIVIIAILGICVGGYHLYNIFLKDDTLANDNTKSDDIVGTWHFDKVMDKCENIERNLDDLNIAYPQSITINSDYTFSLNVLVNNELHTQSGKLVNAGINHWKYDTGADNIIDYKYNEKTELLEFYYDTCLVINFTKTKNETLPDNNNKNNDICFIYNEIESCEKEVVFAPKEGGVYWIYGDFNLKIKLNLSKEQYIFESEIILADENVGLNYGGNNITIAKTKTGSEEQIIINYMATEFLTNRTDKINGYIEKIITKVSTDSGLDYSTLKFLGYFNGFGLQLIFEEKDGNQAYAFNVNDEQIGEAYLIGKSLNLTS